MSINTVAKYLLFTYSSYIRTCLLVQSCGVEVGHDSVLEEKYNCLTKKTLNHNTRVHVSHARNLIKPIYRCA